MANRVQNVKVQFDLSKLCCEQTAPDRDDDSGEDEQRWSWYGSRVQDKRESESQVKLAAFVLMSL